MCIQGGRDNPYVTYFFPSHLFSNQVHLSVEGFVEDFKPTPGISVPLNYPVLKRPGHCSPRGLL